MAFFTISVGHAQVVLDDTFGSAGPLQGPNYEITSDLGKTVDNNLFHSFSEFSLSFQETAAFSGPVSIVNILARITGGKLSNIDAALNERFSQ